MPGQEHVKRANSSHSRDNKTGASGPSHVRRNGHNVLGKETFRVGIVAWDHEDGISEAICDELQALGYATLPFHIAAPVPEHVDFVFSFGPYGEFLHVPRQLAEYPRDQKPVFIHWNTEGLPDLRIPPFVVRALGRIRSSASRWSGVGNRDWMDRRILRFRYVGDYYHAHQQGWLDVFADSSAIYMKWHEQQGLPTVYAPWGATPRWHDDLGLERDLDVLWMGNRSSRRRDRLLRRLEVELTARGVSLYLADNVNHPFIFDEERIRYLNRAKITLNLTRTWYDDNFSRFALAAPNRSLVVSEPLLPHCPEFLAGEHYVTAPIEQLADTIVYYLEHAEQREQIVKNAYQLVTGKLTFGNSIGRIMTAAEGVLHAKSSS